MLTSRPNSCLRCKKANAFAALPLVLNLAKPYPALAPVMRSCGQGAPTLRDCRGFTGRLRVLWLTLITFTCMRFPKWLHISCSTAGVTAGWRLPKYLQPNELMRALALNNSSGDVNDRFSQCGCFWLILLGSLSHGC